MPNSAAPGDAEHGGKGRRHRDGFDFGVAALKYRQQAPPCAMLAIDQIGSRKLTPILGVAEQPGLYLHGNCGECR